MKLVPTSKPYPASLAEAADVIDGAPNTAVDPDCSYDPGDPAAVEAFWRGATVRRPGQRGPAKKPKKVLLSVRYSPEVVEFFKSTGEGWQSRMDDALREWVAARRSA